MNKLDPLYSCPDCGGQCLTAKDAREHCPPPAVEKDSIKTNDFIVCVECGVMQMEHHASYCPLVDTSIGIKIIDPNILSEATIIVDGPRQEAYGHPKDNYGRLAKLWSVVFGHDVTPQQVVLCHMLIKVAREVNEHKRDNLVDIAGYARVMEMLDE